MSESTLNHPAPLPFPVGGNEISPTEAMALADRLQTMLAGELAVESVKLGRNPKEEGVVIIHGRLLQPSAELFPRWLAALNAQGYTPVLRSAEGGDKDDVVLHIMAGVAPEAHPRAWINGLLFVLTVISTLFVGALYGGTEIQADTPWELLAPQNLLQGWPFAVTLMAILLAHEFGHYFAAKAHKVAVTLPYFIPMPLGFGTLGAFIQMKAPVPDRRKLFDIGVAGPLAGLVVAVPLLFIGLRTSPVIVPPQLEGMMLEGNSILYYFAKIWVHGQPLPDPVTGLDVMMNRVTFAAWIGLLVTALNLLPVGQLDGGHTVFALFGERARIVNIIAVIAMGLLAIAGLAPLQEAVPWLVNIGFTGWFFWLILIGLVIGPFHPPALDDVTELDPRRRYIGYAVIIIFILVFTPVPLRLI
jgi:membrane-associated protease RseP (regulator of RpoE activity)